MSVVINVPQYIGPWIQIHRGQRHAQTFIMAKYYGTALVVEKLECDELVQMKMRVVGNGSIQFEFSSPEDFIPYGSANGDFFFLNQKKLKIKQQPQQQQCILSGLM